MAAERTVSVALCTWNGESHLRDQLLSILAQDPPIDELVVSDDASTDRTVAIVDRVLSEHLGPLPVVTVLRNPTALGVAKNFESALSATSMPYVLLSDQDDVWLPGHAARLVAALDDAPEADVVGSDARLVSADGAPLGTTLFQANRVGPRELAAVRAGRTRDLLLKRNLFTGATMAVRRSFLATALPIPDGWIHDEWLATFASLGGRARLLEDVLTDYRQHGGNQIGAKRAGIGDLIARLTMPRTERNERLLRRATALHERLGATPGLPIDVIRLTTDKVDHEVSRTALPARRIRRIGPILREVRTGRYGRFGGGARDALRDFLQPV